MTKTILEVPFVQTMQLQRRWDGDLAADNDLARTGDTPTDDASRVFDLVMDGVSLWTDAEGAGTLLIDGEGKWRARKGTGRKGTRA